MNQLNVKIFYSSMFFILFIFTALSLITSQFSGALSHLFMIFARNGYVYDFITSILYFLGFMINVLFLIYSYKNRLNIILHQALMVVLAMIFAYLFILSINQSWTNEDVINSIISNINQKEFFSLAHLDRALVSAFIYVFFIIMPLGLNILSYRLDSSNIFIKFLESIRPSQNIIIIALFSCAFQPYYLKTHILAYLDFIAFALCMLLLIKDYKRSQEDYGFYEYANLSFLLVGIVLFFITSSILGQYNDYFNARFSFIILTIICWIAEYNIKMLTKIQEHKIYNSYND